jgi:hypothetical protein
VSDWTYMEDAPPPKSGEYDVAALLPSIRQDWMVRAIESGRWDGTAWTVYADLGSEPQVYAWRPRSEPPPFLPRVGTGRLVVGEERCVDYRELLQKYIDHVGECEGVTYIRLKHRKVGQFTEPEWQALRELDGTSDATDDEHDHSSWIEKQITPDFTQEERAAVESLLDRGQIAEAQRLILAKLEGK